MVRDLRAIIQDTLDKQEGVIFGDSAIVCRDRYNGRSILGENSTFRGADFNGREGFATYNEGPLILYKK